MINRRKLLVSAANVGAALTLAPMIAPRRARAATTITLVGYGGSAADYNREVIVPPFTKETGINVQIVAGPDLAKLKAQVQSDRVEWDIFEATGSQAYSAQKDGLWEPIDQGIIDPARFHATPPSFAVPLILFSDGITFDPSRSKNPPKTMAQMFDAKGFPGRRVFYDKASGTLEMALLADGVPPSKMYPLDVERAFRVLDQIKPYVKKWAGESQMRVTMIQTNEADYSIAGTNRVKNAQESGVSIDCSFEQNVIGYDWYCVTKGSRNREAAMKYLEYITRPNVQALLVNKHGLPSAVKGVDQFVDAKTKRWLIDVKSPKNLFLDDEYWADKFVALDKRFKEWTLS